MKKIRRLGLAALGVSGVFLLVQMPSAAFASTSVSYNFDTAGDLAAGFNSYVSSGTVTQTLTGGISDSGAINAPSSANAVFTSKAGYSMGPVGSTYTFSSLLQSVGNNGYSGMGFTSLTAASANASGVPYRPNDALGISVHGGGFVFHNGATDYSGSWDSATNPGITTVTTSSIFDLLNSGSPDKWYKIVLVIDRVTTSTFDMRVEVWPATSTGVLLNAEASAIFELQNCTNATVQNAPSIFSYINFSGDRVRYFDDYNVSLAGGASVIEAGTPVVLTTSATVSGAVADLVGNVADQGDTAVSQRGFAYASSPSPTTGESTVIVGSGTGAFTGMTPPLAAGTYYVRAFATNSVGTSYGSEAQVVLADSGSAAAPTLAATGTSSESLTSTSSLAVATIAIGAALLLRRRILGHR
jgi:hypothetical protein